MVGTALKMVKIAKVVSRALSGTTLLTSVTRLKIMSIPVLVTEQHPKGSSGDPGLNNSEHAIQQV